MGKGKQQGPPWTSAEDALLREKRQNGTAENDTTQENGGLRLGGWVCRGRGSLRRGGNERKRAEGGANGGRRGAEGQGRRAQRADEGHPGQQ